MRRMVIMVLGLVLVAGCGSGGARSNEAGSGGASPGGTDATGGAATGTGGAMTAVDADAAGATDVAAPESGGAASSDASAPDASSGAECAPIAPAPPATAGGGRAVLGLHDGAINHCDNFESWYDKNMNPIFAEPGYPNYAAASDELGNTAWWSPLHVYTVRVSVPWDIALPWSADSALVTAHDPATGQWRQYHLEALKNEQTCFDWWLSAAARAHAAVDVAFKPDYDYRDPKTNHILVPDIDSYRTAVSDFVSEYASCAGATCVPPSHAGDGPGPCQVARVHIITPWGEPDYGNGHYPRSSNDRSTTCSAGCEGNALPSAGITRAKEVFFLPHGSSPMDPARARFDDPHCTDLRDNYCGPVLAAQMWMAVYHACPSCVLTSGPTAGKSGSGIVAGDFSGGAGFDSGIVPGGATQSYLETYSQHLNDCAGCAGLRPSAWGLHAYTDTSNEEWCRKNTSHDVALAASGNVAKTELFLDALDRLGYHQSTYVWLDEISVFSTDNYTHSSSSEPLATDGRSCGVNGSGSKPNYSPEVQAKSFTWLVDTLPTARGTIEPGHEPLVNRIYYFRSFNGHDPDGDNITPAGPTSNQQTLYDAIGNR